MRHPRSRTTASVLGGLAPDQVRVRFPPSPTGNLHVGNVRSALFNWVFARHFGGTFVLRVEDTDAGRNLPESYQVLYDSLTWLGLTWDEGPGVGGPYAPYIQTERSDIYADIVAQLLDGRAGLPVLLQPRGDRGPRGGATPRARRRATTASAADLSAEPDRRAGGVVDPVGGPDAGAGRGDRLRRPGPRPGEFRRPARARFRHRARQRRTALHPGQPGRRLADGDHPRAARRGSAALDAPADRGLRGAEADRRRQRAYAAVRPPAHRPGGGQPSAVQAGPGVRPGGVPDPGLPARGAAQLPGPARLGDRRGPRHLHHRGDGGRLRHPPGERQPGPVRRQEVRGDQRLPHPAADRRPADRPARALPGPAPDWSATRRCPTSTPGSSRPRRWSRSGSTRCPRRSTCWPSCSGPTSRSRSTRPPA